MCYFSGFPTRAVAWPSVLWVLILAATACRSGLPPVEPQLPPRSEAETQRPAVQLFREVVSFKIGDGKVVGQGFYYFRNSGTVTRAFPAALQFFVSSWQGAPKNLNLAQILPEHDDNLPYVWLDQSCPLTQILIPPRGNYCLRADWEQPLTDEKFVYFLRRESPWNRRRELLRLTVLVPARYRHVRLSCPPSFKFRTGQNRSFVIVRENCEPPRDLVVTWKR